MWKYTRDNIFIITVIVGAVLIATLAVVSSQYAEPHRVECFKNYKYHVDSSGVYHIIRTQQGPVRCSTNK